MGSKHGVAAVRALQGGTWRKSSKVSVRPIESIRKPSAYVNRSLLNHSSAEGLEMPSAAPRHTCAGRQKV